MKKSTFTCLVLLLLLCIQSVHANTFNDDRTDFRDEAIYFVITTRFYDGDASNNTQCWDNQKANTGSVGKRWGDIFFFSIFFFPLPYGRKLSISVSRISAP